MTNPSTNKPTLGGFVFHFNDNLDKWLMFCRGWTDFF